MIGVIDNYNFGEMDAMKYFAPPASWSDEKKKMNASSKIFSGEWYAAEKKDGYFTKLVKDEDGNILLYSRSRNVKGEYSNKKEWVPQLNKLFDTLPNGTCLLGELYFPSAPGSKNVTTIMQCLLEKALTRQSQGEKLHFYVFDILAFQGKSLINTPAIKRFEILRKYFSYISNLGDCVDWAVYYNGKELWRHLQEIFANGGEGMVLVHKDGIYEPNKRPSKTTLKIKKELQDNIDCFFTGNVLAPTKEYTGKEITTWKYWEDIRTGEKIEGQLENEYYKGRSIIPVTKSYFYNFAGSLEIGVLKSNPSSSVGDIRGWEIKPIGYLSGLTEEIKANPEIYKLKPIEVTAMEIDFSAGFSLRHGKLVGFREDIQLIDCTWEKIMLGR